MFTEGGNCTHAGGHLLQVVRRNECRNHADGTRHLNPSMACLQLWMCDDASHVVESTTGNICFLEQREGFRSFAGAESVLDQVLQLHSVPHTACIRREPVVISQCRHSHHVSTEATPL